MILREPAETKRLAPVWPRDRWGAGLRWHGCAREGPCTSQTAEYSSRGRRFGGGEQQADRPRSRIDLPRDRKLGLELTDPAFGRGKLERLVGRQPIDLTAIDLGLPQPVSDRRLTDLEADRKLRDPRSRARERLGHGLRWATCEALGSPICRATLETQVHRRGQIEVPV
jgi:hypothetical protein